MNDWLFLIFWFIPSLWLNAQKSSAVIELVNFSQGHVRGTSIKMSNVFYLRLLWLKSLFQVPSYKVGKYIPFEDPYILIKHKFVNKISINTVLMRKLLTHLITMNNALFGSDFNSKSKFFYIYSVYKNYQSLSLQLLSVSRVSQFKDFK